MRRPRFVGEAAVNQAVIDLLDRFQYPDVEPNIPGFFPGGGGGAPTIVVAASDASDFSKQKADFVCTGVSDHDVIQAALDAMDTGTGLGGRLLLTEGTFNCEFGNIRLSDVTAQAPIHLQGLGRATILSFDGGAGVGIDMNAQGGMISELRIFGNDNVGVGGINVDDVDCVIRNVWIDSIAGPGGAGIILEDQADQLLIFGCRIEDTDDACIQFTSTAARVVIANNILSGSDDGILIDNGPSEVAIVGNMIRGVVNAINASSVTHLVITGNHLRSDTEWGVSLADDQVGNVTISGNTFYRCDDGAVQVLGGFNVNAVGNNIFESPIFGTTPTIHYDGSALGVTTNYGAQVVANTIDVGNGSGIEIEEYHGSVVADNIIREPQRHGILVTNSDRCSVTGNVVEASGQATTNTYDQIQVTGDRNTVQANKLIPLGGAFVPRYGVNVVSGECNMVVGNDLGDPDDYGTDALNYTGANTQLVYPADATYGDNFTDCGTGS